MSVQTKFIYVQGLFKRLKVYPDLDFVDVGFLV